MNHTMRMAEAVFRWVLQTSWQAVVLAGLILAAQWMLRKRLSASWRHGLWLLLIARLLMPAAPQSAFSVFNVIRRPPEQPTTGIFRAASQTNPYFTVNSFNGTPSANFAPGRSKCSRFRRLPV
jgi:beta-lactamase regulating signal transducer with metallopeptidase domain